MKHECWHSPCTTVLVAGLTLLSVVGLAWSQGMSGILLDASWSMRGFFNEGSIHVLFEQINAAIPGTKYVYQFKHFGPCKSQKSGLVPYSKGDTADGKVTLIDCGYEEMLDRHPDLAALWLITDNVQDPAGHQEEQGDINRFYTKLQDTKVKQVYIFPTTMAFKGPVYGRDGRTNMGQYPGQRGVIVYGILFDERQEPEFMRSVEKLGAHLKLPAGKGVLAKPLERKVEVGERAAEAPMGVANRLILREGKHGKELTSERIFSDGEPIRGEFIIRFLSRFDHVSIVDHPIVDLRVVDDFQLSDFRAERPEVHPDPPRLEHVLMPGSPSQDVKVRVEFPRGVRLVKNLGALWRNMRQQEPGIYSGSIEVRLRIQKSQLALVEEIRSKYSTMEPAYFTSLDPRYQMRIFGLETLFREASAPEIETIPKIYKINFRVAYPGWPAIVFPALIIGLPLLAAVGLWRILGRSTNYRLEPLGGGVYRFWREPRNSHRANHEDELSVGDYGGVAERGDPVSLSLLGSYLGGGHAVVVNDQPAARIKRSLTGVVVRANRGFSIDGRRQRHLNVTSGGTEFAVEPEGQRAAPQLPSESMEPPKPPVGRPSASPPGDYPDGY